MKVGQKMIAGAVALALGVAAQHAAASLVQATFNDLATGTLTGKAGGTGFIASGTTSVWGPTASASNVITVVNGDLAAPASTNFALVQGGANPRSLESLNAALSAERQRSRAFAESMTGTIWMSYLVNISGTNETAGVGLNAPGATTTSLSQFTERPSLLASNTSLIYDPDKGNAVTGTEAISVPNVFTLGSTALILAKLEIDPAGVNPTTLDVWVNPDVTLTLLAPTLRVANVQEVSGTSFVPMTSLKSIGVGGRPTDATAGGNFDFLTISNNATAYADVTGVAMPSPTGASTWARSGSDSWLVANNWHRGVPNAVDAEAELINKNTAAATIYADAAVTLGTLRFRSGNDYIVTGAGSLTMQTSAGAALVDVQQGNHKLNLPVTINSDTVINTAAGASLRVSDPVTVAAGQSLTHSGDGSVVYESTVSVQANAAMIIAGSMTADALSLGEGATATIENSNTGIARTVSIRSLSAATGGRVDLQRNVLLTSGTHDDMRSTLRDGTIQSSSKDDTNGLGYVQTSDGKVRVAFTSLGDATLDHVVDAADLLAVARAYESDGMKVWAQGDFDYDGVVGLDDLLPLARNFSGDRPTNLASISESFAAEWALAQSLVPEPGTIVASMLAFAVAGRRTRRAD